MPKRHQRHVQRRADRGKQLVNDGHWTVGGLPTPVDTAINILLSYSGSGSGVVTLYTVTQAAPAGAQTAALTVAFAGAGAYALTGSLGAGVYPAALRDSLGTLSYSLL